MTTEYGKAYTAAGFGNWFKDRCKEAGLPKCSSHGLRKATCWQLALAGCSVKQIAAISGHLSLKEVQRYVDMADQVILARSAMQAVQGTYPIETGTAIGNLGNRFANQRLSR